MIAAIFRGGEAFTDFGDRRTVSTSRARRSGKDEEMSLSAQDGATIACAGVLLAVLRPIRLILCIAVQGIDWRE
jgi:hypothetical protein